MRRPAHSFVTGLSKPLETRCGLLKAEASCAIVIALPAHNTVPCLDFLHIFLRCAKKGRKVSRGGRFIGVLLTCRGQCLALKAAPCLQEHVVTRTFINLVFKRLGHSMRIDVCCSASCDTEDHHIPNGQVRVDALCSAHSTRPYQTRQRFKSSLHSWTPHKSLVVPELIDGTGPHMHMAILNPVQDSFNARWSWRQRPPRFITGTTEIRRCFSLIQCTSKERAWRNSGTQAQCHL